MAEDISIVFEQTTYYTDLETSVGDDDIQDGTLQELLEEMLGIHDFAMFTAFAKRAIPQIKLYAFKGFAWIYYGRRSFVEVDRNTFSLEINSSA